MNNTPIILCLSSSTLSFLFFASSLWGRFLISRFWDVHCALCKQGRHRQKVSYVTCMFVFDDRQKSYHDGPKSWSHIQLLIGISLDRQMRDRRKSMCKSPIGGCLIGECLGTVFTRGNLGRCPGYLNSKECLARMGGFQNQRIPDPALVDKIWHSLSQNRFGGP